MKGILPAKKNVQGGERPILFQIGIFSTVDETHVSLKRKPYVLEAGASSTLFPYENSYF
jgi:hypothetical protein